ncbi:MAG TPA: hypothetical protein VLT81_07855 [Chondromyces sp.]|nr:hypothetical protein [Chondromyces sp.]
MSLINDALRKARQAAAEHDVQEGRARPPMAYPSRGPGRGLGRAAVAMIAAAACLAGAAAVWWAMSESAPRRDRAVAAPAPLVEAGGTAPGTVSRPDEPASGSVARQAETTPPPPRVAAGDSGGLSRPTQAESNGRGGRDDGTAEAAPADDDRAPPTPGVPQGRGPTGERVYVLDADLGDVRLSLDFIVFRQVRPFAEINGVEVYEGSEIEGFTVEKIEADQVTLRDAAGPLVLRVP